MVKKERELLRRAEAFLESKLADVFLYDGAHELEACYRIEEAMSCMRKLYGLDFVERHEARLYKKAYGLFER